jgi:hypothetical protein
MGPPGPEGPKVGSKFKTSFCVLSFHFLNLYQQGNEGPRGETGQTG